MSRAPGKGNWGELTMPVLDVKFSCTAYRSQPAMHYCVAASCAVPADQNQGGRCLMPRHTAGASQESVHFICVHMWPSSRCCESVTNVPQLRAHHSSCVRARKRTSGKVQIFPLQLRCKKIVQASRLRRVTRVDVVGHNALFDWACTLCRYLVIGWNTCTLLSLLCLHWVQGTRYNIWGSVPHEAHH